VIFCKDLVSKVSCLVSVSHRSSFVSTRIFAQSLGLETSIIRLEDFGRDSSSARNYAIQNLTYGTVPLSHFNNNKDHTFQCLENIFINWLLWFIYIKLYTHFQWTQSVKSYHFHKK